ncbi:MAG TPA: ABC transporter ATP-binding protein [Kineosporiaceae bacterium]
MAADSPLGPSGTGQSPSAGREPVLAVEDLTVRFPSDDGPVAAVRGMSYTLAPREVLGIVGESGSGKSTAGLAVMGLLPRSAQATGRILFEGQDLLAMPERRRRALRGRRIAMVFQDPMSTLNPVLSVGQQVAEAVRSHQAVSRRAALARAAELLDLVGIPQPAQRLRSYPHEFSGGMRQRVLIAMAVANNPDVIIADEPTSALDVTVRAQILELLMEVKEVVGAAIVLITHDLAAVAGTAQRVLVMYAGRPVEIGTTEDVFAAPRMPYTAGLLGAIPGRGRPRGRLRSIPGAPPSMINLSPGCPFRPRCPIRREPCDSQEPLLAQTERTGHLSACHDWRLLAAEPDPQQLFGSEKVEAG